MARGGKRVGAGRPAGSANKRTREIADRAATEGVTPLEYMLGVLRNEHADPKDRMWAAEKAAPYVHPKLTAIDHQSSDGSMSAMPTLIEFVTPEMDDAGSD